MIKLRPSILISLIYTGLGISWIYFSDLLLMLVTNDEDTRLLANLQIIKGIFYVFLTAFLLYFLIEHYMKKLKSQIVRLKDLNEKLLLKQEELEKSNTQLEQFAYVTSHDLREPLRMVNSFLTLLSKKYEGKLDEKAHQYIHYAVDGGQRMTKMINDLLEYSRVGRTNKQKEVTDLNTIIDNVKTLLQISIKEKNAELRYDNLPQVYAVPVLMELLFQNLITNALKYSKEGMGCKIEITASSQSKQWVIGVSDNGIGIAPENHEIIFGVFKKLHNKDEYEGTGIGLSVCQRIINYHGGKIWVESKLGEGAVFYFTLPKRKPVS